MYSKRFAKDVVVTDHARKRMSERSIEDSIVGDLIETGAIRRMDQEHLFIYKHYPDRRDNLMCAAAVEEDRLVVKSVMIHWTLREQT